MNIIPEHSKKCIQCVSKYRIRQQQLIGRLIRTLVVVQRRRTWNLIRNPFLRPWQRPRRARTRKSFIYERFLLKLEQIKCVALQLEMFNILLRPKPHNNVVHAEPMSAQRDNKLALNPKAFIKICTRCIRVRRFCSTLAKLRGNARCGPVFDSIKGSSRKKIDLPAKSKLTSLMLMGI